VEHRSQFSSRKFNNELHAYKVLRHLQGKIIPKFLGSFTLKFEERELQEDRVCNLVKLEVVHGELLKSIPTKRFSPLERVNISKLVLETARTVHEGGVFFGDLYLSKFLYLKMNRSIWLFGFSNTYDPKPAGVTGQEKAGQIDRMVCRLKSRLEERGYL